MAKAAILENYGDADQLKVSTIAKPSQIGDDDLLIRQTAIGVNDLDILYRRGEFKTKSLPAIIGTEAVGIIEELGKNLEGKIQKGAKVAYATSVIGGYTSHRVIDHMHTVIAPEFTNDGLIASCFYKILWAHALLKRVYFLLQDQFIMVHDAAKIQPGFICQLGRYYKGRIIGTITDESQREMAEINGCEFVINLNDNNFEKKVMKATDNRGVSVVYDSIGASVMNQSLAALAKFGMIVVLETAYNAMRNFDLEMIMKKNLYITTPTLRVQKSNRFEMVLTGEEVFNLISSGAVTINVAGEYGINDIAQAHKDFESGSLSGPIVVYP